MGQVTWLSHDVMRPLHDYLPVSARACIVSLDDPFALHRKLNLLPNYFADDQKLQQETISIRVTSTYMQKLTDTHTLYRYWQCLPGTPSPPPPEVAAGTYLSGKTALFPDSEGGLTGFTPLDPVLPSQNWTVTGTGVIIWPVSGFTPPCAYCVSVQPNFSLGTLCRSYNCSL